MRVICDCTVVVESEMMELEANRGIAILSVKPTSARRTLIPHGYRRRSIRLDDELLVTDVRSAMAQGRHWDDDPVLVQHTS